jgi:hypothetical protein
MTQAFKGHLLPEIRLLCTVEATLSEMLPALETRRGPNGIFWLLTYEVVVRFKGTKLQARLRWKDEVGYEFLDPRNYY